MAGRACFETRASARSSEPVNVSSIFVR
jgi:hypothetical protein